MRSALTTAASTSARPAIPRDPAAAAPRVARGRRSPARCRRLPPAGEHIARPLPAPGSRAGFNPRAARPTATPATPASRMRPAPGNGQCVGTPKSGGSCPGGECCNGECRSDLGEPCPGSGCSTGIKVCTAEGVVCQCPPTVASVSVSPDPVVTRSPFRGDVTLNRAAEGNTTVNLYVNDTNAASSPAGDGPRRRDERDLPCDRRCAQGPGGALRHPRRHHGAHTTFDVKNPG